MKRSKRNKGGELRIEVTEPRHSSNGGQARVTDPRVIDTSDEVLFARFKKGDQQAFESLVQKYKGLVFSFILKSVRVRERAEEIFQDVFFKVIERREQFQPTVSFKAWMMTICRNTCIDSARAQKRRPQPDSLFHDDEKPGELNVPDDKLNPEEEFRHMELYSALDKILLELPEEQRETFYLKVKNELTFEEIGMVMNCSTNTVKSRMRYATEQLRELFKKRGIFLKESPRKENVSSGDAL